MVAIEVKNLTKKFKGLKAVDNVSFEIKEGEIFGLLGPNGAGKTTIIRILTGILKSTEGEAYISKYNIQKNPVEAKQIMGIVPEMANAYIDLSALRNLLLMGELYGIEKGKSFNKAEGLLKLFQLYEKRSQKVRTFSKGMKQRLILAMALMNDSKILFLDEPTGGLDVDNIRIIRDLIRRFNQKGITIFLTTHNIEEANLLCDRVAIMNYGKIMAIDRPEKLKNTIQSTSSIEVAFEKTASKEELNLEGVLEVKKIGDKFKLYSQQVENVIPLLVGYSQDSGNKIIFLRTLGPSLEDVFVKLTKAKEK
jgi:ABC-2 type transport system ATP-binding protein